MRMSKYLKKNYGLTIGEASKNWKVKYLAAQRRLAKPKDLSISQLLALFDGDMTKAIPTAANIFSGHIQ